jgi:N12 class adenine-specific DNA methylase
MRPVQGMGSFRGLEGSSCKVNHALEVGKSSCMREWCFPQRRRCNCTKALVASWSHQMSRYTRPPRLIIGTPHPDAGNPQQK